MDTPAAEHRDVVVIGGGQSGLAAGHHLVKLGADVVILEAADHVGDVWRARYDSLRLYSPAKYDALPGMPFPAPAGSYPTGQEMGDYLEAYVHQLDLPVRTGVRVEALRRADHGQEGFLIEAGSTRYLARQVIVATGAFQRPFVPEFAAALDPAIRQLHSAAYRNPSQLVDGPVLVVGVSHSGADIASELAPTRRTYLSGKSHGELPFSVDSRLGRAFWPILKVVASNLLTLGTPIGRKMAPEVRHGGGPLLRVRSRDLKDAGVDWFEERTVGVSDGRPVLADGRALDVTNVVWCTGFRPDYSWIELPILGDDGYPEQRRGVIGSVPGLYVLGIPFTYGFTSMLVLGASRDAAYVVEHIRASLGPSERSVPRAA